MFLFIAALAILTLSLAVTFEAGIVYVWMLLSSLYVFIPQISLFEGMEQGLYGAASIACLPAIVIASLRNMNYIKRYFPFFLCLIILSAVVLIAGHLHRVPILDQLRSIGGMVVFVLICFLCYTTLSQEHAQKRFLFLLTVLSLVISGYALVDFLFLHKMVFVSGTTRRAGSLFISNANVLSNYCLFFFSIYLALFYEKKNLLYLALTFFYLLCILITFSNSGIAGMFVSFCVVAFLCKIYSKPLYMIYFVLGVLLLLILLFGMRYIYSPSLHHIASGGTIMARIQYVWPVTLELIAKSPMFGYSPSGASILLDTMVARTSTHNEYLGMLLNYGILGSIAVLLFVFLSFIKLNKCRLMTESGIVRGCSIGCLAYMCGAGVYGFAHSIGFGSTITFPFWFLAMALIGMKERGMDPRVKSAMNKE